MRWNDFGFVSESRRWAAYGWPDDPLQTTDETILERLLAMDGERARNGHSQAGVGW